MTEQHFRVKLIIISFCFNNT